MVKSSVQPQHVEEDSLTSAMAAAAATAHAAEDVTDKRKTDHLAGKMAAADATAPAAQPGGPAALHTAVQGHSLTINPAAAATAAAAAAAATGHPQDSRLTSPPQLWQ